MSFTFKKWDSGQNRRESSGKKMSPEILGSGKKLPYLKNIYPWKDKHPVELATIY